MKKIICVSSLHSVGCTFVDWSIHFLSGQSEFYSIKDQGWRPVVANPVSKINAHGHDKNHPNGLEATRHYIDQFQRNNSGQLFSFYTFPMFADVACQQLGHAPPQQLDPELTQKIQAKGKQDWADTIDHCLDQNVKVIYIELNQKNLLYTQATRSLDRMFFEPRRAKSAQEAIAAVDDLFFQQDLASWQQQGLVEIWDRRELLALCRRPFDNYFQGWTFDRSRPHLWLDSESLWFNGQHAMSKIMEFCDLPVCDQQWEPWLEVYHEWQQLQLNILEFTFNLQHIVEAIVNGWYYEIPDLTFEQEVVIQHCLIYQHGLNLKTWRLEKFPSNTQQLHQLLEPNMHKVESIY